jgi:hypothetical protein
MTLSTIVAVNLVLSALVVLALFAIVRLARRLPTAAPQHDERWGRGGNPWVVSDPLPLHQIAWHESERELAAA